MSLYLQVADEAVGIELRLVDGQFVDDDASVKKWPQLHVCRQVTDVGQCVALVDGTEIVDTQVEWPFQSYRSHGDVHARLLRYHSRHLIYCPVLDGRQIEQCGEYHKQQEGRQHRNPHPHEQFLHRQWFL